MANSQDHVWHILRDVLELLAGAGIPTPERGYALDGGWSLALSDLRRLVNDRNALRAQIKTVIAERDSLRAELAAAKEEIAKMRSTIISAMVDVQHNLPGNGHAKLSLLLDGIMKQPRNNEERLLADRKALAADNARLRKALETIDREMSDIVEGKQEEIRNDLTAGESHGWTAAYDLVGPIVFGTLAATPAQSLAAHDAALLREVARLDWLQHKETTNIEADVQDRFGIDLDSDEYPKHKNLRAAIDAAMEEGK